MERQLKHQQEEEEAEEAVSGGRRVNTEPSAPGHHLRRETSTSTHLSMLTPELR